MSGLLSSGSLALPGLRAGAGLRERRVGGQVILEANRTSRNASAPCQLRCSDATEGGTHKIAVSWGTINGRQPTGFHAGGQPVFKVDTTGSEGWIYAKAVASLTTLQWISSAVIVDTDFAKDNTPTICYRVIGSYKVDDKGLLIVTSNCGNVEMDMCELSAL